MSTESSKNAPAEWFYIGHFGQLGPLTQEQLEELIVHGVVLGETYVWRQGTADWVRASAVPDFASAFRASFAASPPPPPPLAGTERPPADPPISAIGPMSPALPLDLYRGFAPHAPVSDKNRYIAGILQFIPGIGRLYLGYAAQGILQLLLTPLCGLGWMWSVVDGIVILAGGVRYDGYGRRLPD